MAGSVRVRSNSSEASETCIDQLGIALAAHLWTEAELLEHTWSKRVDEDIGLVDELEKELPSFGGLG